jgi:hypothetical protein
VVPIVVAWIALVATQAVSSGAGWGVLYHFGPSVLIGAAFIFAALPEIFDSESVRTSDGPLSFASLGRGVILITAIVAIFSAWQTVPTGARTHPRQIRSVQALPDLERYVSEIEHEFSGMNADRVLLGLGNWVYLEKDILQKDRAVSLGDQPLAGIYDNFAVTVDRLRNGSYDKILVQDFHSPYFLYDWHDWPKSSGFRSALLENYTEVRTIQPPQGNTALSSLILYGGPVSVFVPKHQLQ